MDERYDLGTAEPFVVPDMIGEPLRAWRAWKIRFEMRDFVPPQTPEAFFREEDGLPPVPPPVELERRPYLLLDSINQGFTWNPREVMVGICKTEATTSKIEHPNSEVPKEGCSCGIHALDTPLFLAKTGYVSMIGPGKSDFVWGEIAMWGKIIRGTTGIKSQYAYPRELYIRPDVQINYRNDRGENVYLGMEELKDILALQYGVPVEVIRTVKRPNKNTNEVILKLLGGANLSRGGSNDGNR